jgi:hypothetical protein
MPRANPPTFTWRESVHAVEWVRTATGDSSSVRLSLPNPDAPHDVTGVFKAWNAAGPVAIGAAGPTQSVYWQNGQGQQPDAATLVAAAAVVANTPSRTVTRPNSLAFIVVIPSERATGHPSGAQAA